MGNELNLKDGTLSKSIAIKAGQDVFTELRKQILVDKKDFIVTEGGRLLCRKIIHGILRHWDKPDESKRVRKHTYGTNFLFFSVKFNHTGINTELCLRKHLHVMPCLYIIFEK